MTNQAIQSRIAKWRIQAIYGIKDVKVLHRESFFADNYESNGKIGAKLNQKYAIINALPRILIETIFMVSILGYLVVCVALGDDMTQMLPTLTAFGLAAVRLLPCVNRINTYLTDISYFRPCLDYVYENMNINEITKKTNQNLLPVDEKKTMQLRNRIELKDIVYAYPNTDTLIFDHADMEIPYGKSIGIMGPSGAGKSTIVDILLGLLKVHEGQILCDGDNVFENYLLCPSCFAFRTIGRIPFTGFTVPSSPSSPTINVSCMRSASRCPSETSIPTATGKSYAAPSFLISAGEMLTVILLGGISIPVFLSATLTLSLASRTS